MEKRKTSKDKTAYLFKRYVWLLDIIYNNKKITYEDISNRWRNASLNYSNEDLPLKTFHNHRQAINEMFEIDILCDRKDGNKYYIEYEKDLKKGEIRTWLLNTFAVSNLVNESHKLKGRILFENIPSGQIYLTPIIEAMRDNLSIRITYQKFIHNKGNSFEIHPYCVKIFKQRWYVIAYNPYKKCILTYALDRINAMEIISKKFDLQENFDGKVFFNDSYGIIVDDNIKSEKILIKIYGNDAKYVESLPLHHSQKLEEKTDNYSVYSYLIKPTYDFKKELLSFGNNVEILAPDFLRKEFSNIVLRQYKHYFK